MDSINEIFHHPSFKKDFAFVKQLEHQNKGIQDKIWEKFIGTYNKKTGSHVRIVNTRFESHPSGLSSDSDRSLPSFDDDLEDEPKFLMSETNVKSPKDRSKSASSSKITLNEIGRKKLRKKLTQHLRNGTLDKFEVKNIGDSSFNDRKPKEIVVDECAKVEELYLDRWRKSESSTASTTPKSPSDISLKDHLAVAADIPPSPKIKEKINREVQEELNRSRESQIMKSKVKVKERGSAGPKSPQSKDSKKFASISWLGELRKSRHYIEKCIGVIKEIGLLLNHGIEPPDGSEDYTRRHVRTREFTSRFSRVYMYPLVRHLSAINTNASPEKSANIYSKFTAIYQLIYQALQACFNHFPSTVGTGSYHKLKEHLSYTVEVCDKNTKCFEKEANFDNEDYVSILKSHCTELMSRLDDNFLSPSIDSLLKSRSTRASLVPAPQHSKNMVLIASTRGNLQRRFAMYNTSLATRRDRQWRRMLESLEGRKPKVKSRYRNATFKHRPPVERQHALLMAQPGKHRLDDRRSLTLLRNTPVATPMNEDNIQTMIQYDKERGYGREDSDKEELEEEGELVEGNEKQHGRTIIADKEDQIEAEDSKHQQGDILTKLLQLVQGNDEQCTGAPDANLTNTIKVLQQCLNFKRENSELFKKMAGDNEMILTSQVHNMAIEEDGGKKQRKNPLVTVSGAKNAQLICIKDDNSIVSNVSDKEDSNNKRVNISNKNQISAEVQTSISKFVTKEEVNTRPTISNIKIGRVNRQKRLLELLPKEYAINVIQYKLAFHKHHKGDHMYRKTSTVKPWELMDKISEEILDFALLGIAKEIEVNELLENIYNAEFQY